MRWTASLMLLAVLSASAFSDEKVKPIKALLITGGCCHDYSNQKMIITEGTSARAHIEWVVVQQGGSTTNTKIPVYEDPEWAKKFDIIVHNECFADIPDPAWTERILKPHREGIPAVVIHCAMHCYRDKTGEWFKFVGVTSHRHGAHYPFDVINLEKNDPIMKGFPDKWATPKGELYQIEKIGEFCKPLAHARSKETKKDEPCIWTNQYGKARVFGTTIGHYNEEMADPVFLDYLTRGILWSCNKLEDGYLKPFDASKTKFRWQTPAKKPDTKEPPKAEPKKDLSFENLATGKTAVASSVQDEARNAAKAIDGEAGTRWCAKGPIANSWWQVDLGKLESINGVAITWEHDGAYGYQVETSNDGKSYQSLVDLTGEKKNR
jgi:type 1 glutamine amidotransferase